MPAINAAASPVNAVASPSPQSGGNGTASSSERPFATVLAEQSGKAPRSNDSQSGPGTVATAKAAGDETEAVPQVAAPPIAADVPIVIQPFLVADFLESGEKNMAAEGDESQVQTATELIQAVLMPAGAVAGIASAETALTRQAGSTAAPVAPAAEASPAAMEVVNGMNQRGETIADMRLAVARNTHGETAADDGSLPAKLAVQHEIFALPAEVRGTSVAEPAANRAETGTAQPAAPSIPSAVPMQPATAAVQTSHGGEYRIATPVGSQQWESAIGNSLVVMTGSRQDRAELVLTPPQLGRIEVSITMKGDEATAVFVSANPAVREALESALPRLREVLADAGISLGQAQVGAESQGQWASERQNGDNASRRDIADATGDGELPAGAGSRNNAPQRVVARSLVDTYA